MDGFKKYFWIYFFICTQILSCSDVGFKKHSEESSSKKLIVLMHGLGRTRLSMLPLAWHLESNGYEIFNYGYCSFNKRLDALTFDAYQSVEKLQQEKKNLFALIGFSTGGAIIRNMLSNYSLPYISKSIFISSPLVPFIEKRDFLWWTKFIFPVVNDYLINKANAFSKFETPSHIELASIQAGRDRVVPNFSSSIPQIKSQIFISNTGHTGSLYSKESWEFILNFLSQ